MDEQINNKANQEEEPVLEIKNEVKKEPPKPPKQELSMAERQKRKKC